MKGQKRYLKSGVVLLFIFFLVPTTQSYETEPLTSLVINEVMYHPAESESTNEWIELYNPTASAININGWTIADGQEEDNLYGDASHGDGTTLILPGCYALITDEGTQVYEHTPVPENAIRLTVDDSTLCGYGLNNKNEEIFLKDQLGVIVDAVEWGKDYEDIPGSPAPVVSKGYSLDRRLNVDTDDTLADFFASSTPTPGAENIQTQPEQFTPHYNLTNKTTPNATTLVITQVYYHTHSSVNNEFITLYNPTNTTKDISEWYLTDVPWKDFTQQAKLQFPDHTTVPPFTALTVTQNASAYEKETACVPDYEYKIDSQADVPQLTTIKTVTLSNTGGLVALKNTVNQTVDLICYGETTQISYGWNGPPIPSSGAGVILTRTWINGTPQDTDSASDWIHPRIYRIGQSDFPSSTISFTGEVILFVSPDNSYETIVHELRTAQQTIDINMYEFTSSALYAELITALQRNITVRLFMEGSPIGGLDDREKYILTTLASYGGLVRFLASDAQNHVTARYQFDHAKYIIIDNTTVIVESCNWAKTGIPKNPTYGNREWGIVIRNAEVAESYAQVFQDDWNPRHDDSYPIEAMNLTIPSDFSLGTTIPAGSYKPRFPAMTITGSFLATPLFSPDTSEQTILHAIRSANRSIYVQQLYIYRDWGENLSPFVEQLVNKSQQGVSIKIILDYNPNYEDSTAILNETKEYLEAYGVEVKFLSTTWSPFATVHNKGMIIDNTTVLISSVNWNEQSVRENREAGVILENEEAATYYAAVFLSDWDLDVHSASSPGFSWAEYKYYMLIAVVFSITLALILRDWRKRKWR
jgi:cardiolipin synthase